MKGKITHNSHAMQHISKRHPQPSIAVNSHTPDARREVVRRDDEWPHGVLVIIRKGKEAVKRQAQHDVPRVLGKAWVMLADFVVHSAVVEVDDVFCRLAHACSLSRMVLDSPGESGDAEDAVQVLADGPAIVMA